jgi:hypothetical protein
MAFKENDKRKKAYRKQIDTTAIARAYQLKCG